MPISIVYQPAASAIAGPALLGGQGQYAQWLNQFANSQYQFGQNLEFQKQNAVMDRLTALNQMANQNAMQQQQQAFQMQMAPQQAMLDAQQQAYQSQLANQSHQQQQMLGSQLGSQQSRQDFAEQQQLEAQKAAQQEQLQQLHVQQQQEGELANKQAMGQFQQDQGLSQQFLTDPLYEYKRNQQQAQQNGYSFSDAQEEQMSRAKNALSAMQASYQNGENTLPTMLPEIRRQMAVLSQISKNPEVAPPPELADVVSKKITYGWKDPTTGEVKPGTENTPFTVNEKGEPLVVRGYKMDAGGTDESPLVNAKVEGQQFKNEAARRDALLHRAAWITKEMRSRVGEDFEVRYNPEQIAGLRNQIGQEYDQTMQTGGAMSMPGPAPAMPAVMGAATGGPSPAMPPPEVTGANPQAQNASTQVLPQEAMQVAQRLKSIPRERWSKTDWALWANALAALGMMPKKAG